VPDAPQNPANARSLLPLTRPHDPNRMNKPSSHQQNRTKESFLTVSSAPKSSKNSSNAKTSTNAAVPAAASLSTRPHDSNCLTTQSKGQQNRTKESFLTVSSAPKSSKNSSNAKTSTNAAVPAAASLSTRPHDSNCLTTQSKGQQNRTKESFLTVSSAPKSSKNSSNAKTSTNAAVSAADSQTAEQPKLVTTMHATHTDESTTSSTTSPTIITDSTRSSAFWAKNTIAKTPAAATAALQAAEPPGTPPRRARCARWR